MTKSDKDYWWLGIFVMIVTSLLGGFLYMVSLALKGNEAAQEGTAITIIAIVGTITIIVGLIVLICTIVFIPQWVGKGTEMAIARSKEWLED